MNIDLALGLLYFWMTMMSYLPNKSLYKRMQGTDDHYVLVTCIAGILLCVSIVLGMIVTQFLWNHAMVLFGIKEISFDQAIWPMILLLWLKTPIQRVRIDEDYSK